MTVKVTGFGSAVKIALEEVFVRIDVPYQKAQSILGGISLGSLVTKGMRTYNEP
jgi:hypothetical protein